MSIIVTNLDARQKRIDEEVERAFNDCKKAADNGITGIYFITDRDIQRDVREVLQSKHNIYVPTIISRYAPSRLAIEHFSNDKTEMKLNW